MKPGQVNHQRWADQQQPHHRRQRQRPGDAAAPNPTQPRSQRRRQGLLGQRQRGGAAKNIGATTSSTTPAPPRPKTACRHKPPRTTGPPSPAQPHPQGAAPCASAARTRPPGSACHGIDVATRGPTAPEQHSRLLLHAVSPRIRVNGTRPGEDRLPLPTSSAAPHKGSSCIQTVGCDPPAMFAGHPAWLR